MQLILATLQIIIEKDVSESLLGAALGSPVRSHGGEVLRQTNAKSSETAIAIAFLRHGHPWLAFGTVVLKTCFRASLVAAFSWAGVTLAPSIAGDGRRPQSTLPDAHSIPTSLPALETTAREEVYARSDLNRTDL